MLCRKGCLRTRPHTEFVWILRSNNTLDFSPWVNHAGSTSSTIFLRSNPRSRSTDLPFFFYGNTLDNSTTKHNLDKPTLAPPPTPPPWSTTTVKTRKKDTKDFFLASPSLTDLNPDFEDDLDELKMEHLLSRKLPQALSPDFRRPVSATHADSTKSLIKKTLALKLPDITVGQIVSADTALSKAPKIQFSQNCKNNLIELSINNIKLWQWVW